MYQKPIKYLAIFVYMIVSFSCTQNQDSNNVNQMSQTTICNPINLSYRFSLDKPSRREAADPTMVVYKNEYYLFASKSGGYFHSTDLIHWDLIKTR